MLVSLETNRLILRPFTILDAESMYLNWTSDEEVTKFVTWNKHQNIEETIALLNYWVKQYEKEERINFAIVLKDNNELIGGIDVVGYLDGVPVLGYCLSRKYWNNGYTSEACNEVINFLFSLGHNKIIIDAQVKNIASNKVIQKCKGQYLETYKDFNASKNQEVNINRYIVYK